MAPSATTPEPPFAAAPTKTPPKSIQTLQQSLACELTPLAHRFRALFALKHLACHAPPTSLAAITAMAAAFASPSALLKHEVAYCLGQSRNAAAVPHLRRVLGDYAEDAMVRHEAAEALGALGDEGSLGLLREVMGRAGEDVSVRETCELAIGRIEWVVGVKKEEEGSLSESAFTSVDPAPPMPFTQTKSIEELERDLLDTEKNLWQRYRTMFTLRDLASPQDRPTAVPAVLALAKALKDPSALLRHEIAFVFGQLVHPASIPALRESLARLDENPMVRHEAAEALGSLGDQEGVEEFLRRFLDDKVDVVRESVIVALDMAADDYAPIPTDAAEE